MVWEAVPNVNDTVSWQYEGSGGKIRGNITGIVEHRHFWPSGDVTLTVKRA